jgi:arylsulfate sulfotransferase
MVLEVLRVKSVSDRWVLLIAMMSLAALAEGGTVWVGPNSAGPVDLYATDGTSTGTYGPTGATAATADGLGDTFVSVPNLNTNQTVIFEYGSDPNTPIGEYTLQGTNPGASDGYLDDLAYGGSGTLWAAGFNGTIYHIDFATATVLSAFDTGSTNVGVGTDGSILYTTTGFGSGELITYAFDGTPLSMIFTGLTDSLGIGYDPSNQTLWVGGDGVVSDVDGSGVILNSFAVLSATGDPIVASGVEVAPVNGVIATPEPATLALTCLGLLGFIVSRLARSRTGRRSAGVVFASLVVFLLAASHPAFCTPQITALSPSLTAPQPVGTSITWTATASDAGNPLWYRFSASAPGGTFSIFQDYQSSNSFVWTPAQLDGLYQVQVTVKNQSDQTVNSMMVGFTVSSRVTTQPVVSATPNALVALYSAPACPAGASMRVRFWKQGTTLYSATPARACAAGSSMNFYVAGMTPNTTYSMQHDVLRGPQIVAGPLLSFTTGALPVSVSPVIVRQPQLPTSQTQGVLLFSGLGDRNAALDMNGNVLWYYQANNAYISRPEQGGNSLLLSLVSQNPELTQEQNSELQVLREIDIAGNTLLLINAARISELLGFPVNTIHHEGRRLPNGDLIFLTNTERFEDQGAGPVDVIGDVIVVLDANLNLKWSWNAFDHLDVSRPSTSGDVCVFPGNGGCPPIYLAAKANDWTHGNSLYVTPDGKFIIYSSRHQDRVFELDYNNDAGAGDILWTLGFQGDFTLTNGNASDWFSHQHEVEFELNGEQLLSLFDNGNTRQQPASTSNSRGQAYLLDMVARTATLEVSADLGFSSQALGSAQRLTNGNYQFDLGLLSQTSSRFVEVNPAGAVVSEFEMLNQQSYRCFRLKDLYTAP